MMRPLGGGNRESGPLHVESIQFTHSSRLLSRPPKSSRLVLSCKKITLLRSEFDTAATQVLRCVKKCVNCKSY